MEITNHGNLTITPLAQARETWDEIAQKAEHTPVECARTLVEYYEVYLGEPAEAIECDSCVIAYAGEPVAIWPFWWVNYGGAWQCGGDGRIGVLPPVFAANTPVKIQKAIEDWCLSHIEEGCRKRGMDHWECTETLFSLALPEWHKKLMDKGATLTARHELYMDLSEPYDVIKSRFRKSYKPLISKAESLWQSEIIAAPTEAEMEQFRQLHIETSGKETRSANTWEMQRQACLQGQGFVIFLRDDSDKLVGAALYQKSPSEAKYTVGVYDRSLFDQPVSHIIQTIAIQELQRRGIRWYKLGDRNYTQDDRDNSEKFEQIGFFKSGFGADLRILLHIKVPVSSKSG